MRIPLLQSAAVSLSFSPTVQKALSNGRASYGLGGTPIWSQDELPGGTPIRFCEVSDSTDLFNITSAMLSDQPLYIDDVFVLNIYGVFQSSFKPNATLTLRTDCGSHCEEYGAPPGETPGESVSVDFCEMGTIEQPSGGRKRNVTCPPEEGAALVTLPGWVWPMFLSAPGWYNFTVDVKTREDERIFCMTSEVCLRWKDPEKNKHYPPGPWSNCTWPR